MENDASVGGSKDYKCCITKSEYKICVYDLCFFIDVSFLALRRSTEISLVIRQTMEACILTHLMPRSQVLLQLLGNFSYMSVVLLVSILKVCLLILQIDIFVQVLQADGGKLRLD